MTEAHYVDDQEDEIEVAEAEQSETGSPANERSIAEEQEENAERATTSNKGGVQNKRREPDRILQNAVEDCKILYSYCARQKGEAIFGKGFEGFVDTVEAIDNKSYSNEDVERSYRYLNSLGTIASPATPASIRGTFYANIIGVEGNRLVNSRLRKSLNVVEWLAVVSFLITVFLALYVSVTDNIVRNMNNLVSEYLLLTAGQIAGTRLEGYNPPSNVTVPPTFRGGQMNSEFAGEERNGVAEEPEVGAPEATEVEREADGPSAGEDGSGFGLGRKELLKSAIGQVGREIAYASSMLSFTTLGVAPENKRSSMLAKSAIYVQIYFNSVVTTSIMPLFSSILGVVVFIMRDASRRMESVSLSPLQSSGYRPRLILGVIAGLVVGWFTGREETTVLGNLSPTAAAFVIGYSTEILFNILDSLRQGLGSKD